MSTAPHLRQSLRALWALLGLLMVLGVGVPTTAAQEPEDAPRTPTATAPRRTPVTQTSTPSESQPTGTRAAIPTNVANSEHYHPFAPRTLTRGTVEATATSVSTATSSPTEAPPTSTQIPTTTATSTPIPPSPTPTELRATNTTGPSGWFSAGPGIVIYTATPTSGTRVPTVSPTREIPIPPPIRYAGVPTTSFDAQWLGPNYLWLGVPHRTQLDGSVWAQSNCGPASLGMVLGAYGLTGYPTDVLRGEVNRLMGNFNPDSGTSLPALATVARRAGLFPMDLNKRWTLNDVRTHLAAGRPIITLVRYADLPGNGYFDGDINHYIVLSGFNGDQIIYNDAAHIQGRGRALLIAPEVLERGWRNSNIPSHGVAFALNAEGAGVIGRTRSFDPEFDVVYEEEEDDAEVAAFSLTEPQDDLMLTPTVVARAPEPARPALQSLPSSRGGAVAAPTSRTAAIRSEPATLTDPGPSQLMLSTYLLLIGGVWVGARVRRRR